MSRRALLGVGVVCLGSGGLGGCGAAGSDLDPRADRTDLLLAEQVATTAGDLAARIATSVQRYGRQRTLLLAMAERHRAHARSFAGADDPGRAFTGRVPGSERSALRDLLRREQRAAAEARSAALRVASGQLAAALASCAACLAQHVVLLEVAVSAAEARSGGRRR